MSSWRGIRKSGIRGLIGYFNQNDVELSCQPDVVLPWPSSAYICIRSMLRPMTPTGSSLCLNLIPDGSLSSCTRRIILT